MRSRVAALLLALLLLVQASDAMYIKLRHGEQRCFLEEVPAQTLLEGNFKAQVVSDSDGIRMLPSYYYVMFALGVFAL
jgi:hypothetical protein